MARGKNGEAYERAMNDVIEYRRSKDSPSLGVCPALYDPDEIATLKARFDRY
jgi:hypothetical protein